MPTDEDGRVEALTPERDYAGNYTGLMVCHSCHLWNCWHFNGQPCDVRGCQCTLGTERTTDANA